MTDPRRATRAHGEFKMSCAGDARRFSTVRASLAASDAADRRGPSTQRPPDRSYGSLRGRHDRRRPPLAGDARAGEYCNS